MSKQTNKTKRMYTEKPAWKHPNRRIGPPVQQTKNRTNTIIITKSNRIRNEFKTKLLHENKFKVIGNNMKLQRMRINFIFHYIIRCKRK